MHVHFSLTYLTILAVSLASLTSRLGVRAMFIPTRIVVNAPNSVPDAIDIIAVTDGPPRILYLSSEFPYTSEPVDNIAAPEPVLDLIFSWTEYSKKANGPTPDSSDEDSDDVTDQSASTSISSAPSLPTAYSGEELKSMELKWIASQLKAILTSTTTSPEPTTTSTTSTISLDAVTVSTDSISEPSPTSPAPSSTPGTPTPPSPVSTAAAATLCHARGWPTVAPFIAAVVGVAQYL